MIQGHLTLHRNYTTLTDAILAQAAGRLTPVHRREAVLATIPCDVAWVNDHWPRYSYANFQMKRGSFGNLKTTYRKVMKELGLIASGAGRKVPVDSEWGRLFAALDKAAQEKAALKKAGQAKTKPAEEKPEKAKQAKAKQVEYGSMGLRAVGVWCHFRGIPLSGLSDEVMGKCAADLRQHQMRDDIPGYIRGAINIWNEAVRSGLAGPMARLLTVTRARPNYTLVSVNPVFDAEKADLKTLMIGKNRNRPRTRSEPGKLKAQSVKMYLYRIKQAVTAHAQRVGDCASIRMADLVEPNAFDDILAFFYDRTRAALVAKSGENPEDLPEVAGVTSQTSGIANTLIWVARNYLKLPPHRIEVLLNRASAYRPKKPDDLNPKVRARLDQLAVPAIQARLLFLPKRLMRLATEIKDDNPEDAARMAMIAAAVIIEIYCPLRLTNLTQLRIGENVVYSNISKKRIEKLCVPLHRTKNDKLYEWPLDREAAQLVERYIREFRSNLAGAENAWLFPAADGSNRSRGVTTMSATITAMIEEHVGAKVNVHLFRSFAACLLLKHSQGALNDVRMLLGHKSFEATMKHYHYLSPEIIAGRHRSAIRQASHELEPLVRGWFNGKRS